MANFGSSGGTGAPRFQEANGEWKAINVCLKFNTSLSLTGIDPGYIPIGTLITTSTDNTDGCYSVLDTVRVAETAHDMRHVLILAQEVKNLHLGDQQVAAVIEGIWTLSRWYHNGPALSTAQEDLIRQRLTQRWDGV